MFFYVFTSAGHRGRCWNLSLKSEGFNTFRGGPADVNVSEKHVWSLLLHKNIFLLENLGDNASKSSFFLYLRTARGFLKYCKKGGGGGFLAFKSHIICASKKSCMKIKVDIVCFSLNSIFLIDPKNDDCAEEKDVHGLLLFFFFCDLVPIFSPPFLLFFSSFPLPFFSSLPRIFCA